MIPLFTCSGLWGLIGTGLFMITPASECNLHEAFEGLCYCTLRLPPMVRLSPPPLHPLPQLWKVPSLFDVTSELGRKDGSTGHWIPDNDSYIVGQFICTVWTSLCDPNWTFHLDRVKVKVSLTTSCFLYITHGWVMAYVDPWGYGLC